MSENRKKILEMLAENKISADEAYRLLAALDANREETESLPETKPSARTPPKYLRVTVMPGKDHRDPSHADRINVRVPLSLIRAGIKLAALIPPQAHDKVNGALKDKGFDFDLRNLKKEDLEELVEALSDMHVDVESGRGEKIRIFVE